MFSAGHSLIGVLVAHQPSQSATAVATPPTSRPRHRHHPLVRTATTMPAQPKKGKLRKSIRQREAAKKRPIRKVKTDDNVSFPVVSGRATNIIPGKIGAPGS